MYLIIFYLTGVILFILGYFIRISSSSPIRDIYCIFVSKIYDTDYTRTSDQKHEPMIKGSNKKDLKKKESPFPLSQSRMP